MCCLAAPHPRQVGGLMQTMEVKRSSNRASRYSTQGTVEAAAKAAAETAETAFAAVKSGAGDAWDITPRPLTPRPISPQRIAPQLAGGEEFEETLGDIIEDMEGTDVSSGVRDWSTATGIDRGAAAAADGGGDAVVDSFEDGIALGAVVDEVLGEAFETEGALKQSTIPSDALQESRSDVLQESGRQGLQESSEALASDGEGVPSGVAVRDGAGIAGVRGGEREWAAMTVAALKDELRKRGLKVSGKKAELVERLLQG